jgi:hypothetical protein
LAVDESAELCRVDDGDLIAEMEETALALKKKVYDNRRVTFAPLSVKNLRKVKAAGLGTYQVFQETHDRNLFVTLSGLPSRRNGCSISQGCQR